MESQLHSDAERIVTQVSGETVAQATRVNAGVMTFKYFVETVKGYRYVVRFYPEKRAAVASYEPDIIHRCLERGMRVPEVIATSRTGPTAGLKYMLYRMIPGVSLDVRLPFLSQQSLNRICSTLIDELKLLRSVHVEGFGDLVFADRARFSSWLSFVAETFLDGIASARGQDLLPSKLIDDIDLTGRHLDKFTYSGQPSLCWGDISPQNIIVDENGEIVGLIDFEGVVSAEFDLNLGYLRARYAGTSFYSTFAETWLDGTENATSARAALYVLVRALRLLSQGREPLPTGIPREQVDTFLPGLEDAIRETHRWIYDSSC